MNNILRFMISGASCSALCSTLLAASANYDKVLPESINTGGEISVTADCRYASTGGSSKGDCFVGMYSDGGYQNFAHHGNAKLTITPQLPTGQASQPIIFALHNFSTDGTEFLHLKSFHAISVSSLNLTNKSYVFVELEDQRSPSTSQYGATSVFILRDDYYGQTSSQLMQSSLKVTNGNMIIGKTSLLISEGSTLEVAQKAAPGGSAGGGGAAGGGGQGNGQKGILYTQGHITNHGNIIAETIKNGESINVTGGTPPPGIGNQNISGVIDNYGIIKATMIENVAQGTINLHSFNGNLGRIDGQ